MLGLRAINTREIHLTVPGGSARKHNAIIVHRTRSDPHRHDLRSDGPFRVTAVTRTLIDLASCESSAELERLVTLAVQKRLLRLDAADGRLALEEALGRHVRHPGMKKLAAVLAAYRRTEDHKSQLELAFDRFLAQHPEIPEPRRNIHIDVWEIDRFWPEHHLAVELDGRPYHIAVKDMERDRIKDAALQKLGVVPFRVTDFRFEHDRPAVLGDLRDFLKLL
jgi:very-short-patch-repair endonuclease